ncbi:nucleoside triphosphate pyrophosphohydrolase, partial [Priestia megaterium]
EYIEAQTHQEAIEELADLLEVMHALAAVHGSTPEQLEKVREEKAKERGKFDDRVYLVETEDV